MGAVQSICSSLQRSTVEEVDIGGNSAYRYPPKSGCYFGSHFTMGGQRFDTPQPEAYLFGENSDLNYMGSRPATFPYPASNSSEPTKTLKSLVNIRKDSLRLVKDMRETEDGSLPEDLYHIDFTFDSEATTAITIYFFATEEVDGGVANYTARENALRSETFRYDRGANQQFSQPAFKFSPSTFDEEEFSYDPLHEVIPIVIQCCVEEGDEHVGHCHTLLATFELTSEGTYAIKYLKQKQMIDGVYYLLQEIYGIENKNNQQPLKTEVDELLDDNGSDCAICLSDPRDTLILPCRHLCLCNSCADNLRYQASSCPICRAPFRALLQIRALRKVNSPADTHNVDESVSQENVPPGYEAIPLGEALNGPSQRPVMGAEGGATMERTADSSGGESRSKRKKKSRNSSAGTNRSRQSNTDLKKPEKGQEAPLEKPTSLPVDVVSGTELQVTDLEGKDPEPVTTEGRVQSAPPWGREPCENDDEPERAQSAMDSHPTQETQIEFGEEPQEEEEDNYMKEDFESDTISTVPSLQPSSIVTDETEDSGFKEQPDCRVNLGSGSPTMTTVDVDLPGTPAGVSSSHSTLMTGTPTSPEDSSRVVHLV
ncbi:E3 ubiquitin-protein ligase MGRN1-like isoform X2 [Apostichopus japonicus]|uniref:E3 ubiquitin-protein ligase MGRN1-like isoform X2 n=1 Tax=Stichopus japonicus TaxID=307972 RepID=UPI003AB13A68